MCQQDKDFWQWVAVFLMVTSILIVVAKGV